MRCTSQAKSQIGDARGLGNQTGWQIDLAVPAGRAKLRRMAVAREIFFRKVRAGLPAWVALMVVMVCAPRAVGHQIPSLTVEAFFSADRSFALHVSLDPRLFLSDQPSSLPPVPAEWYRDQTQSELAETARRAREYLRGALELKFGEEVMRVAEYELTPMDGATNAPLGGDSKEVHLLAAWKGRVPEGATSFQVGLGRDANVSMILINSFEGEAERRPNVIFPGETSRAFVMKFREEKALVVASAPEQGTVVNEDGRAAGGGRGAGWALVAFAVVGVVWLAVRALRARPGR